MRDKDQEMEHWRSFSSRTIRIDGPHSFIPPGSGFVFDTPPPIAKIETWESLIAPRPRPQNRAELILSKIERWREGACR